MLSMKFSDYFKYLDKRLEAKVQDENAPPGEANTFTFVDGNDETKTVKVDEDALVSVTRLDCVGMMSCSNVNSSSVSPRRGHGQTFATVVRRPQEQFHVSVDPSGWLALHDERSQYQRQVSFARALKLTSTGLTYPTPFFSSPIGRSWDRTCTSPRQLLSLTFTRTVTALSTLGTCA